VRDYGRIHTRFWTSQDIRELSGDAKLLAAYLLTGPHSTIAGVFRLPDGYVTEDLGWSSERVIERFMELFSKGFSNRCETTKWVVIHRFLTWNKPENPNQWKAVTKIVMQVPEKCDWRIEFYEVFKSIGGTFPTGFLKGSETVSKGSPQDQDQDQDIKRRAKALTESKTMNGHADEASRVWDLLVETDGAKPARDSKVEAALKAIGGYSSIKRRKVGDPEKVRDRFCDAYRGAK
jgi:hypothetical protein